ncbi:5-(carboxyamino)imidazole ribonucleotide synthase [Salsuginibacillus halophilus]|uniref:N5-carboxyaminoimidazole ribonucleotide synthase n=1 Tax=Salsuginibacillus halophilus TaxID=517424 RepID=A0A2P8HLE3_9BACI|nr:5-(carboxyamino)imidazole ribonucleotide synthase [Salsuginibacillus halophilus]PSL47034.1 5-(carboxyamino)imidazole ribonucleotide synthase [Salsuginibacillus halophilus]
MIQAGSTIGILGGGQLGRMMALAARHMGFRIAVLEPKENSSAGQVADHEIIAAYDDPDGLRQLNEVSDVITFEFENVDAKAAAPLIKAGKLPQGTDVLKASQHRLEEKSTVQKAGVKVAAYAAVHEKADLAEALKTTGFPAVLKTCRGGYDGKGQAVVHTLEEAEQAVDELTGELVLEALVHFDQEISVIIVRNEAGETICFPPAENIHQNGILHQSIVPARTPAAVLDKAEAAALKIADHLGLVGTLAIEMFVQGDDVFVNEMAPRPHNSGHYTMNGTSISQFEAHIQAVAGWPLRQPELYTPTVMVNILGEHVSAAKREVPQLKEAALHLYDKGDPRAGRKMGHVNVNAATTAEALARIEETRIWT